MTSLRAEQRELRDEGMSEGDIIMTMVLEGTHLRRNVHQIEEAMRGDGKQANPERHGRKRVRFSHRYGVPTTFIDTDEIADYSLIPDCRFASEDEEDESPAQHDPDDGYEPRSTEDRKDYPFGEDRLYHSD